MVRLCWPPVSSEASRMLCFQNTFRRIVRLRLPIRKCPSSASTSAPPAAQTMRRSRRAPAAITLSKRRGTPESPNIAGFAAAFSALTADSGSMKCSMPATFATGSYSVTPMHEPSA
jgi:hypothetical protein